MTTDKAIVTVKPLEWSGFEARASTGDLYSISRLSPSVWVTYMNGTAFPGWRSNEDAAKAVAQARHDDKLAALTHTNQKTEGTEGEDVDPPAPVQHPRGAAFEALYRAAVDLESAMHRYELDVDPESPVPREHYQMMGRVRQAIEDADAANPAPSPNVFTLEQMKAAYIAGYAQGNCLSGTLEGDEEWEDYLSCVVSEGLNNV